MTLTGTWLLPIAIIPGAWEACGTPRTPRDNQQQIPSQPRPSDTDDTVFAETQAGDPGDERILDKSVPLIKVDSLRESGQNTSKDEPLQGHLGPGPSVLQTHPGRRHPDLMYSNPGSFHYTQSQYPPGAFFVPISDYTIPADGHHRPMNPEYPSMMYELPACESTAPPPVVLHTVPLPDTDSPCFQC
jgi:hypothetical protein